MITMSNKVINKLDMIHLRELYRGLCGKKLAPWMEIPEAKDMIITKIMVMNKEIKKRVYR